GLRGLTHRAVDEAAGLPQGSTSNHARTRAALLETALRRLADLEARMFSPRDAHPAPDPTTPDGLHASAGLLADALHRSMTEGRQLLLARFELALEATRRPELRRAYDDLGRGFRDSLEAVLRAAGSPDSGRHARSLVSWFEGVLFHFTAGSSSARPPDREELRTGAAEVLRGMLRQDVRDGQDGPGSPDGPTA
ncbi:TetR family transcriptional regulator, partial [Streptomyces sp. DJ]